MKKIEKGKSINHDVYISKDGKYIVSKDIDLNSYWDHFGLNAIRSQVSHVTDRGREIIEEVREFSETAEVLRMRYELKGDDVAKALNIRKNKKQLV